MEYIYVKKLGISRKAINFVVGRHYPVCLTNLKNCLYEKLFFLCRTALRGCRDGFSRLRRFEFPPPPPDEPLTLAIRVSGIEARSATVLVTPSNATDTYYFAVAEAAALPDDKALIASDLTAFGQEAQKQGLSLEEYLTRTLSTGNDSYTYSNKLEPETDYAVYAYGLTPEGAATTAVFRESFRTPARQQHPSDCTFTMTITDISASEATVDFVPSDNATRYFYAVLEKEAFDKIQAEGGIFADDMVYFEYLAQQDSRTVEETIRKMTATGTKHQPYVSLSPETDYYAYAYGLEPDGYVTTELYTEPFRTKAPERVECTFAVSIEDVTAREATVTIIPSDKTMTYLGEIITDEQIQQGGDGDLATYYTNYFRAMADMGGVPLKDVVADRVLIGDFVDQRIGGLDEGVTYNVIAVGVDAYGNFITEVELVRFTAENGDNPVFTITLTDLSDTSVRLDVTPANAGEPYLAGVIYDESINDGGVKNYLSDEIQFAIAYGVFDDYFKSARVGPSSKECTNLIPGGLYHAYAIGMNNKGEFTTELCERTFTAGSASTSAVSKRPASFPRTAWDRSAMRSGSGRRTK